jgi:hypothetical protein
MGSCCSGRINRREQFDTEATLDEVACPAQPAREWREYIIAFLLFAVGGCLMGSGVLKQIFIGCDPDEEECDFTPSKAAMGPGITLIFFALFSLFTAKQYICSIRITPSYVGVQDFMGNWDIYDKKLITTFRPATKDELDGKSDKMCDGKTIIDDAAPEENWLKDHTCFSYPSEETKTHLMMVTSDGEHWLSMQQSCPWRSFTPIQAGKAEDIAAQLNVALKMVAAPEGEVVNELAIGGAGGAATL